MAKLKDEDMSVRLRVYKGFGGNSRVISFPRSWTLDHLLECMQVWRLGEHHVANFVFGNQFLPNRLTLKEAGLTDGSEVRIIVSKRWQIGMRVKFFSWRP